MRAEIGVSRLCCPVCSELLSILAHPNIRPGEDTFNIDGFHSVISVTELPPWLPKSVLEEMLVYFSKVLCSQLVQLPGSSERGTLKVIVARLKAENLALLRNIRPPGVLDGATEGRFTPWYRYSFTVSPTTNDGSSLTSNAFDSGNSPGNDYDEDTSIMQIPNIRTSEHPNLRPYSVTRQIGLGPPNIGPYVTPFGLSTV